MCSWLTGPCRVYASGSGSRGPLHYALAHRTWRLCSLTRRASLGIRSITASRTYTRPFVRNGSRATHSYARLTVPVATAWRTSFGLSTVTAGDPGPMFRGAAATATTGFVGLHPTKSTCTAGGASAARTNPSTVPIRNGLTGTGLKLLSILINAWGEWVFKFLRSCCLGGVLDPGLCPTGFIRPQPQDPIRGARSSRARALHSGPAWVDRDLH